MSDKDLVITQLLEKRDVAELAAPGSLYMAPKLNLHGRHDRRLRQSAAPGGRPAESTQRSLVDFNRRSHRKAAPSSGVKGNLLPKDFHLNQNSTQ